MSSTSSNPDRRSFLMGSAGGLAIGGAAGIASTYSAATATAQASTTASASAGAPIPFYGNPHPAEITTPPQQNSVFTVFDLKLGTATELKTLLARWSAAIDQLQHGKAIGAIEPDRASAVALDTGEAEGMDPSRLTVSLGLGPGVFDHRFGLEAKKPALLEELPAFASDRFAEGLTGGDISLHACADNQQVAYHAIRVLARMARTEVRTRWSIMGFNRASSGGDQPTPRNLMGFKDGTRNITTSEDLDRFVYVAGSDQPWMDGGSFQISRKIQMFLEIWDAATIESQNLTFGRHKQSGAPLTGSAEFDTPDFSARGDNGDPVIDPTSHVALSSPENNGGTKILRRPYNYTDGINAEGRLDAGLHFISYVNDPAHFITLQSKLGKVDLLNEYIKHVGSGIFAVPPNPAKGEFLAEGLFD